MEKSIEKWIQEGKKNGRQYFFYENYVLDLTQFIFDHPGGVKAIKNYLNKDITNILFQVYHHIKQPTLNILFKYKVGTIPKNQGTSYRQKVQKNHQAEKSKKKVCFTQENNVNEKEQKKNQKKSVDKKKGLKQSTNKSKNSKKHSSTSKSKKQYTTSIKVLDLDQQQRILSDYNSSKKVKTHKKGQNSCSFINNQLDQQKPIFKVPVLNIKLMQKHI